jgi:signal transduction histidine kinase
MDSPSAAHRDVVPARDGGVAALLAQAHDLAALERMLLAWAVHPAGAACDRAALYAWSSERGALVGRIACERAAAPADLDTALARAARSSSDPGDPDRMRRLRAASFTVSMLADAAAEAWTGDGVGAAGRSLPGADESSHPGLTVAPEGVVGAVRLMRDGAPCLLVVGAWSDGPWSDERLAALVRLRRAGEASLRAERERSTAARRGRQLAALAEFAGAIVSPLNLAEVLDLASRLAMEACDAQGAALWLGAAAGSLELESTQGAPGARERCGRALTPLAMEVVDAERARLVEPGADGRTPGVASAEVHAAIVVPVVAYGVARGALAVHDRVASHPSDPAGFDQADVDLVTTLADQLAIAVDQARRGETLKQVERRCEELRRELARRERLAALGEMAARVAHEVRNPLASIGAFARRAHRQLADDDPGREYLEIVIREAERLERMVGEQLQYATLERPRFKLESVNGVVQEALQAAGERLVRRRVRLLKRLSPDLPPLLLDSERIGRVVGNILDHALDAVAPGGRIRIESRRAGAFAVVEIAHDGQRHPGELLEQLFVPFAVSRQGGGGVGLAVAQQVLKQHGGEIRVRGEGEWSSVFSFTLPIPENEDRRRPGRERRASRADRRTPRA